MGNHSPSLPSVSVSSISSCSVLVSMEPQPPLTSGVDDVGIWPGRGARERSGRERAGGGSVRSRSWGWWDREGRWAQPSPTGTLDRKQGQRTEKGLVSHLVWSRGTQQKSFLFGI